MLFVYWEGGKTLVIWPQWELCEKITEANFKGKDWTVIIAAVKSVCFGVCQMHKGADWTGPKIIHEYAWRSGTTREIVLTKSFKWGKLAVLCKSMCSKNGSEVPSKERALSHWSRSVPLTELNPKCRIRTEVGLKGDFTFKLTYDVVCWGETCHVICSGWI